MKSVMANPANSKLKKRRRMSVTDEEAEEMTHDSQTFALVFDPYAPWRIRWNLFLLVVIGYVMVVVPFEISFVSHVPPTQVDGLWVANLVVDLFFLGDMVLTFNTAYERPSGIFLL